MRLYKTLKTKSLGTTHSSGRGEFANYYKLLVSVLTQAIDDYIRGSPREKSSATIYLNSGDGMGLFSFLSICSYLHLDAKWLRAGIEKRAEDCAGWKEGRKSLFYGGKRKDKDHQVDDEAEICPDEDSRE